MTFWDILSIPSSGLMKTGIIIVFINLRMGLEGYPKTYLLQYYAMS